MMSEEKTNININEITSEEDKQSQKITKKSKKFRWWQSVLLLFSTLVVSIVAGYIISDKYFWSNVDINRINEQVTYYKNVVDADPNNPKHRVDLGYSYYLKGDEGNAIKQYKVALDLDKDYFDAYLNLGIVYNDEDRFDDALEMAQKSTELAPRDYKGFLLKGIVYRKLEMYEDAIESLDQANVLTPGNTDIITEIARVAEDTGEMKDAEELYKEALNYDPLYKPAIEGLERIVAKKK
jgi:tetratricopeptide (TPR) repeat protein